jgi:hypothetical protein
MLVAFRAKPIEGICGNCEFWKDEFGFDHMGICKFKKIVTGYAHRCDVEEKKSDSYPDDGPVTGREMDDNDWREMR